VLDSAKRLKAGKSLFQRGDGSAQIVPARRQRSSEDRIRRVRAINDLGALLLRGNVLVEKLGMSIEIADQGRDPRRFHSWDGACTLRVMLGATAAAARCCAQIVVRSADTEDKPRDMKPSRRYEATIGSA
jgi:hypothetical protein